MRILYFTLVGIWATLFAFPAAGQDSPLFSRDEVLEMNLRADLSTFREVELRKDKRDQDFAPVPGTLSYSEAGQTFERSVKVQPRGFNRFRNCPALPPLKLTLEDFVDKGTLFEGIGGVSIKLATPCFFTENLNTSRHPTLGKPPLTEYVLREYAIYKSIESFGIPAFRTRLVKMTYQDMDGRPFLVAYSFFIEPVKVMERRYNARYLNFKKLPRESRPEIKEYQMMQIGLQEAIFQEPVDHAWYTHHDTSMNNRGFLFSNENKELISVLCYDFDWSYLVGSPLRPGGELGSPLPSWAADHMALRRNRLRDDLVGYNRDAVANKQMRANFAQVTFAHKSKVLSTISKIPLRDRNLIVQNLNAIFHILEEHVRSAR